VSEQPPPTPGPDAHDDSGERYEDAPAYRPHRPAKPIEDPRPEPWYEGSEEPDVPRHTGGGGYDPAEEYFTAPEEPYLPATPPERTLDRTTALVAALVLTALVGLAGWTTAALALTRDRAATPGAARPSVTPGRPLGSPAPPAPSLAEAPCGPATAVAGRQGLTQFRGTPSATVDGSGTDLRLRLRCTVSSEEFDLSVDLLRSPDAAAVDEFFDVHRRPALGGGRSTALPGVGERAFVTVDDAAVGGRATVAVDVAGNRRAMSLVGTTSGDYPTADAQALLVAIAQAYLTAR
jgi:hypothetical protein